VAFSGGVDSTVVLKVALDELGAGQVLVGIDDLEGVYVVVDVLQGAVHDGPPRGGRGGSVGWEGVWCQGVTDRMRADILP